MINQAFSKIGILIILIILIGGVFLAWQYLGGQKGEIKLSEGEEIFPSEGDEVVSIGMFPNIDSFDLINKTFEGLTQTEGKKIKVITSDSTKFYSTAEPDWEKEHFTFSEFHSLLKNWDGPPWPFTVKGIFEEESVIKAEKIFYIIQ